MLRVFDEYARAAGAAPEKAPAVLAIRIYIEQAFGAWRVVGGLSELATAMYERCLKRGVGFRFDTEVTSVASGVVTCATGEKLTADVIVAAVDSHVLRQLTGANAARANLGAYSPSIFSVKLGVREGAAGRAEMPYETVLFGDGAEPTIRVQVAPEQPNEWIAFVDAPLDEGRDGDVAGSWERRAEEIRTSVARRLPIAQDALSVREIFTPADREQLTGAPGGSANGPAIDSLSSAILRSPTVQPIKGLLHVGGSSRPGPGIAFAALSAWNAAEVLRPTRV
jgi:phytoene dehydrogenase-like protein